MPLWLNILQFNTAPANPLQIAWENGIAAYYSRNYHDAIKDFQNVESLNPGFGAAKTFEQRLRLSVQHQSNAARGTSVPAAENTTFFGIPKSTFLIGGIAAGSVLLIVLS